MATKNKIILETGKLISDLSQPSFLPPPLKTKCLQCQKEWSKFKSELTKKELTTKLKEKKIT